MNNIIIKCLIVLEVERIIKIPLVFIYATLDVAGFSMIQNKRNTFKDKI